MAIPGRQRFALRLRRRDAVVLLVFGVTPRRAWAEIDGAAFRARFGVFRFRTALDDISGFSITGPYRWYRAIGVRWSPADGGLTFGSSAHGGVCVHFREPVRFGPFRVPALTVTVDDVTGFAAALTERGVRAD